MAPDTRPEGPGPGRPATVAAMTTIGGEAAALRRAGRPLPVPLSDPHPDRLDRGHARAEAALAAHRRALVDGADGYVDPITGLFCFTAGYHWDKGTCCELGCRHCPWLDADLRLTNSNDRRP